MLYSYATLISATHCFAKVKWVINTSLHSSTLDSVFITTRFRSLYTFWERFVIKTVSSGNPLSYLQDSRVCVRVIVNSFMILIMPEDFITFPTPHTDTVACCDEIESGIRFLRQWDMMCRRALLVWKEVLLIHLIVLADLLELSAVNDKLTSRFVTTFPCV